MIIIKTTADDKAFSQLPITLHIQATVEDWRKIAAATRSDDWRVNRLAHLIETTLAEIERATERYVTETTP